MGFYEFAIGIGSIVVISMIWVLVAKPIGVFADTMMNLTPSEFAGQSVNQTAINEQISSAYTAVYVFIFIFIILVLIWVVKESIRAQKVEQYV